ncbi:hypothetical protein ACVBEG_15025 [Pseudomonas sp. GG8]
MAMNKPTQYMRRDLKKVAGTLKWSSVDLLGIAVRLSEAGIEDEAKEILKLVQGFNEAEEVLLGYTKEIGTGLIVKASTH